MNWPKLIVEYGQLAAWSAIAFSVLAVFYLVRRPKRTLARKVLSLAGCLVAAAIAYGSVGFLCWASIKVNPLKPILRDANKSAPDFQFALVGDDSTRSLADYRGQVVVLNLWASWCPPCRQEMPALIRLQNHYANDGVVVITVSDEPDELQAKFTDFAQMPFVKGRIRPASRAAALYVRSDVVRPVTHIIDRDGILRDTLIGGQSYETLERSIRPYLAQSSATRATHR